MKKIILLLFVVSNSVFSQKNMVSGKIKWYDNIVKDVLDFKTVKLFAFETAQYKDELDFLPFHSHQIQLGNQEITSINVINFEYEQIDDTSLKDVSGLRFVENEINVDFYNAISRKVNYGVVSFVPIRFNKNLSKFERVVSYQIELTLKTAVVNQKSTFKNFTNNSVLSSGDWYKIAVTKDGVFKLSYSFLKDLGIDVNAINPQMIKIYGNGGKMLPEINSASRNDDLVQNAIYIYGENDGVFNADDYILFYGQSPHSIKLNTSTNKFYHELNRYSDTTYYFITASSTGDSPKRIMPSTTSLSPNNVVNTFNDFQFHEIDNYNLIKSGQDWFGEVFDVKTEYDFIFNIPNLDNSIPVDVFFRGAARSKHGTISSFTVSSNGVSKNISVTTVNIDDYTNIYAVADTGSLNFISSSSIISVKVNYNKPLSSSVAWLDYLQVNSRRNLKMHGNQLFFRDLNTVGTGNVSQFNLTGANNVEKIWDISNPFNIRELQINLGSTISFVATTDTLRQFVAFTSNYDTQVFPRGKVNNQNLHALGQNDYIIVAHPNFLSQAEQIADFHRQDGLSVVVVTPNQIYNEFSSGSQDPIAIRSFIKMFYDRATISSELPKYLLLFGDGSYDNKNRILGNTNYIPTYQSVNSLNPIGSLVTDDYFGLLDPNEGNWSFGVEYVDVGIGRIPAKSQEEADNVVNKILNYKQPQTMKDWRNQITFIGDVAGGSDTWEGNIHMSQSDSLARMVTRINTEYNPNKIFFDAYKKALTPGGSTFPDVNKEIIRAFNEGSLIINYTGHGGEAGWAHERVLTISDINKLSNTDNFPLVVTATCEFSRFDDPRRTSAGELTLINKTGALALLTTVRLVYSSPNFLLNKSFYENVFVEDNNEKKRLGEIFMITKNLNASNANNRNFTLLGDPALKLAYPKYDVATTKFNGTTISTVLDTVKALQKVTIEGFVKDYNGNKLSNYNGIIYPTVFDKAKTITTLQNHGGSVPFVFNSQNSKLFKGKVSVTNGDFSFSFVVPKDIAYNFGKGKLSYYAENQVEDANGYFTDFYIGGTSDSYAEDTEGPEVELFMNDKSFVFGGITDENPTLLAYVQDIHGINMVGNGIGHDIVAVLDDETDKSFVLNNYYEADLNSYQKGTIRFPFKDLKEGRHKLTLKVWDVYNNSREVVTEFNVVKSKDVVLSRVYNYPNPFTTYTEFWFEHNQANKQLYAQVQVFTVTGKLVKTIEKNIYSEGFRSTSITWDGLDDFGDRLARGVYIYHLKVRAENLSIADKYEKLVILR